MHDDIAFFEIEDAKLAHGKFVFGECSQPLAASVSFVIVVAGIVMAYFNKDRAMAGYVATVAGVLGEFVAAVFFYLYNKTIVKMGEYHEKLVLTQNISLAMKIAEGLEGDHKSQAQLNLVEYLSKDINQYLTARTTSERA